MHLTIVVNLVFICSGSQKFLYGIFDQQRITQDTHDLNNRSAKFKIMFNDSNETICDDSNMYLYSYCILGFAPEGFDTKMLFDPFEEYSSDFNCFRN